MSFIWHTFFFDPVYNVLVFFIDTVPHGDIGLAIVFTTVVVKVFLLPLSLKAARTQHAMREIEPELKEIQTKFKDKREEQARAMMDLYKTAGVNPFSSILLLFIQIPIIIALYQVFLQGASVDGSVLYSFVQAPEQISNMFLGINMSSKSIIVALIAGVSQYFQLKRSPSMKEDPAVATTDAPDMQTAMMGNMQKTMKYTLPVMITVFAAMVPAAYRGCSRQIRGSRASYGRPCHTAFSQRTRRPGSRDRLEKVHVHWRPAAVRPSAHILRHGRRQRNHLRILLDPLPLRLETRPSRIASAGSGAGRTDDGVRRAK